MDWAHLIFGPDAYVCSLSAKKHDNFSTHSSMTIVMCNVWDKILHITINFSHHHPHWKSGGNNNWLVINVYQKQAKHCWNTHWRTSTMVPPYKWVSCGFLSIMVKFSCQWYKSKIIIQLEEYYNIMVRKHAILQTMWLWSGQRSLFSSPCSASCLAKNTSFLLRKSESDWSTH